MLSVAWGVSRDAGEAVRGVWGEGSIGGALLGEAVLGRVGCANKMSWELGKEAGLVGAGGE